MRKACPASQPCPGGGNRPGAMGFIPLKRRVCPSFHFGMPVGCRNCRVHDTCTVCLDKFVERRICTATAGFASLDGFQLPPSPPIFGLFQVWVVVRWQSTGRDAESAPGAVATDLARCASYHSNRRVCPSARRASNLSCFASFRTGLQLGDGLAGHSEYLTWNLVVCARRKTPRRLSWSVTPSSTPAKCWSVVVRSKASSFHLRFRFNSAGRRLSWDVFPVQCA